jgi:hypothetical protein
VQGDALLTKATTGESTSSTCTFSSMDNNFYDRTCASGNTPYTTCSTKVAPHSAIHPSGVWSPDIYGSTYKGSGDVTC